MRIDVNWRWLCVGSLLLGACWGCSRPNSVEEVSVDPTQAPPDIARPEVQSQDWPAWRGPQGNGIVDGQDVPVEFSATKNVVWKTPVPGRGHSSPTIVGDRVYLATAVGDGVPPQDDGVQLVLCFDRKDGAILWQTEIHRGGFDPHLHAKNTQASSTIACDGERLFIAFLNDAAIHATALNLDGKILWQKNVGDFQSRYGYSASPAIYEAYVIIAGDNQGGGFLAALNRETGEIVWRKARPADVSYASPAILHLGGRDQVVLPGCDQLASYDPLTGEQLWSVPGTTQACVGTAVQYGDFVFASGGFPGKETICVNASGTPTAQWRNTVKCYVPSLLQTEGNIYAFTDNGIAHCWDAKTGAERWKARLGGGDISASPILVQDRLYIGNERGTIFVIRAQPGEYELLAENQLGDEMFASPAVAYGQLFLRTADSSSGTRQETLYCIASADSAAGVPLESE